MDIRQMRYFLAIVEAGSISRAAQRLNVAQPSLSLHVRNMEEALATPLLIRGPGGVTPTEAGDLLARRARVLLTDLDRAQEEVRGIGRDPSGAVRLGLPGTISGILSVPLIAQCRARHPGIKIVVAEAMSGFVREWLSEGRVDLAVLYDPGGATDLTSEMLLEEELVLLEAPAAPDRRAATGPVAATDLPAMPLILPSEAHGLRQMIDATLAVAGRAASVPEIEVDSYAAIKRLVEDGYGASVLPFHAVAQEVSEGRLSVRPFAGDRLWRAAHLVRATARPETAATRAVRDLLRAVAVGLIDQGVWAGARRPRGFDRPSID